MSEEQKKIEEKAKRQGWIPEDDYAGDGEALSAEAFLKKGEEILAIKNERFEKQGEQLATAIAKIDSMEISFKEHGKYVEKQTELTAGRHKAEIDELKEKQRVIAASAEPDMGEFDRIGKKIETAEAAIVPEKKEEPPGDSPDFPAFQTANPWYNTDFDMTEYANRYGAFIFKKHGAATTAFYNEITTKIKEQFPAKFSTGDTNKNVADVEGATGAIQIKKTGKKGYNDLPPEAKVACDKLIKDSKEWAKSGLREKPLTQADYLKDYEWE